MSRLFLSRNIEDGNARGDWRTLRAEPQLPVGIFGWRREGRRGTRS
jgi:hypothetical protein